MGVSPRDMEGGNILVCQAGRVGVPAQEEAKRPVSAMHEATL